jgi:hypothetical protein
MSAMIFGDTPSFDAILNSIHAASKELPKWADSLGWTSLPTYEGQLMKAVLVFFDAPQW